MKKILSTATVIALLTGCASGPLPNSRLGQLSFQQVNAIAASGQAYLQANDGESFISKSQEAVARGLKDPSSAQFRNVRVASYNGGSVVCGEVNGKNSYGGYVGFKRFVAAPDGAKLESQGSRYWEIDATANLGLDAACH